MEQETVLQRPMDRFLCHSSIMVWPLDQTGPTSSEIDAVEVSAMQPIHDVARTSSLNLKGSL